MSLDAITRARIVMDLLKDGDVANESNYVDSKVDYIGATMATRYVDAFCRYFGGPTNGDNEAKAAFYLERLREHHKSIWVHGELNAASAAAGVEAGTKFEGDLGTG